MWNVGMCVASWHAGRGLRSAVTVGGGCLAPLGPYPLSWVGWWFSQLPSCGVAPFLPPVASHPCFVLRCAARGCMLCALTSVLFLPGHPPLLLRCLIADSSSRLAHGHGMPMRQLGGHTLMNLALALGWDPLPGRGRRAFRDLSRQGGRDARCGRASCTVGYRIWWLSNQAPGSWHFVALARLATPIERAPCATSLRIAHNSQARKAATRSL